jgi:hypothetical protein
VLVNTILYHMLILGWFYPKYGVFWLDIYSLRYKIRFTVGHNMRFEIEVMFGEISLILCQTNWNVAINNVNIVVDELSS